MAPQVFLVQVARVLQHGRHQRALRPRSARHGRAPYGGREGLGAELERRGRGFEAAP